MDILVLGGTEFLGRHFVETACERIGRSLLQVIVVLKLSRVYMKRMR
ncbi:MAG: hypothetical protein KDD61_09865 [Bdellovibrionales bacterium]|nr:hypothetical protein [Bdellovibrionales bacterium]